MAQGQLKAAREVLEQARDRAPERVDLWVALAEVAAPGAAAGRAADPRGRGAAPGGSRGVASGPGQLLAPPRRCRGRPRAGEIGGQAGWFLPPGSTASGERTRVRLWAAWRDTGVRPPLDPAGRAASAGPGHPLNHFDRALQAGDEATAQRALEAIQRVGGERSMGGAHTLRLSLQRTKPDDKAALNQIRTAR